MPLMMLNFTCDTCGLKFEELVDKSKPEEMSPECLGCKEGHGVKDKIQSKNPRHISWSSWNAGS